MGYSNKPTINFAGGEVSNRVYGRTDLPIYNKAVARMVNWIADPQGSARFRQGSLYVHHTRLNQPAVLIPFQFNDAQSYLIEATNLFFRFYKSTGLILNTAVTITGISNANPGHVLAAGHGYANGAEILLTGLVGMTQLNGTYAFVANASMNTFDLADINGNPLDTTFFTPYVSGGQAQSIYEIATPYLTADLETIQYAQDADVMYLTNVNFDSRVDYEPRKLTRTTETNWSLGTYSRTADPFTGTGDWPAAVAFTQDARVAMAGTLNKPSAIWGSQAPTTAGALRYDDFTTGTTATNAYIFTLSPVHGKAETVRWLSNTDLFLVAGCFGTIRRLYGSGEDQPVTPINVNAKPINTYGSEPVQPVTKGITLFYVERGGFRLQSIEYDFTINGYSSIDRNLVADHMGIKGMKQAVSQLGRPDMTWIVRRDGVLLGLTYDGKENISAWHTHTFGGNGLVKWIGVIPRPSNMDQLFAVVQRVINGQAQYFVESVSDQVDYPDEVDFFTAKENEAEDHDRYLSAQYELLKFDNHLDAAAVYDGSVYGANASATLTTDVNSNTLGASCVFTTNAPVFDASMVGRQIWGRYDMDGIGGGRATITAFTSSTNVTVQILKEFMPSYAFTPGNWFITATRVSGLDYLEGSTVGILADGCVLPWGLIQNGQVSISRPASVISVGLPYVGILKGLAIDQGGLSGPAQNKPKNLAGVVLRLVNSAGVSFGTNLYRMQTMDFRRSSDYTGRPVPLFNGAQWSMYEDEWALDKHFYVVQEAPLPCTISCVDLFVETTDED